ncbi:MAG: DUF2764 domain-containing protein [Spirochaetia bacterium]|nr:DUF2764 domain-containing protein [Spirochaetia bacterium]
MSGFYFTIASLPELQLFASPPISHDQFLHHCTMELSENQLLVLENIIEDKIENSPANPEVLKNWNDFKDNLNREIAVKRSEKLSRDDSKYQKNEDSTYFVRDIVKKVMNMDSPLEAEKEIMRESWNFLEDMESRHLYDFSKLILYILKLRILERYAYFTYEDGEEQFREVFSNVQSRIKHM